MREGSGADFEGRGDAWRKGVGVRQVWETVAQGRERSGEGSAEWEGGGTTVELSRRAGSYDRDVGSVL